MEKEDMRGRGRKDGERRMGHDIGVHTVVSYRMGKLTS